MNTLTPKRGWIAALLVGLLSLMLAGTALAAEFGGSDDVYRLPSGETINDDLYVGSGEIFIDGTVDGDLYAAGGYIEVNGTVTGDVVAAGGGIVIRGKVGDDVRVAGGGVEIAGTVGDDVFMAGGGGSGFSIPIQMGARSIQQGVRLSGDVGGDAAVAGGEGWISGNIAGDLYGGMGTMTLSAQVGGNADISAGDLRVEEGSTIEGTLKYSAPNRSDLPAGVAGRIDYEPTQENVETVSLAARVFGWLVRTVLIMLGIALLGWLFLRFAPNALAKPVTAIEEKPVETGLYGLIAAVLLIFIPILSAILVALVAIFWGAFPAVVMFVFLFGSLALLWFFSPLITGLWLGQHIATQLNVPGRLAALLIGALLLVLLGRIPFVGWLVYLFSFILAIGGLLRWNRVAGETEADLRTAPGPA